MRETTLLRLPGERGMHQRHLARLAFDRVRQYPCGHPPRLCRLGRRGEGQTRRGNNMRGRLAWRVLRRLLRGLLQKSHATGRQFQPPRGHLLQHLRRGPSPRHRRARGHGPRIIPRHIRDDKAHHLRGIGQFRQTPAVHRAELFADVIHHRDRRA